MQESHYRRVNHTVELARDVAQRRCHTCVTSEVVNVIAADQQELCVMAWDRVTLVVRRLLV